MDNPYMWNQTELSGTAISRLEQVFGVSFLELRAGAIPEGGHFFDQHLCCIPEQLGIGARLVEIAEGADPSEIDKDPVAHMKTCPQCLAGLSLIYDCGSGTDSP